MKKAAFNLAIKPLKWFFNFLKKHWKLLLILAGIIGLIIFWQIKSKQAKEPKLVFAKPQMENLTKTLEVSGLIDAKEKANLRFIAGGKVTYIGAKEGDFVKKRQRISNIDLATLQKQLQQDLNLYMKERWDWEQTLDNTKDRALPKSEIRDKDKSQWDLDNTVLDVEIRDIAIKNSSLTAPFDGVLVHTPTLVPGVQLLATDYFELVNPQTLVFRATVDDADIANVKTGQTATVKLDAYPDEKLDSQVNYISFTSSQTTTGTAFIVEFPLNNYDLNRYRIGMNGDVDIILDTRQNVLAVPLAATKQRDDKTLVSIRTGEKTYEDREIKTGLETDDKVEVLSGLTINDEILVPE